MNPIKSKTKEDELGQDVETPCKCCEALGLSEIVQWLADEDAKADIKKQNKARLKKQK